MAEPRPAARRFLRGQSFKIAMVNEPFTIPSLG